MSTVGDFFSQNVSISIVSNFPVYLVLSCAKLRSATDLKDWLGIYFNQLNLVETILGWSNQIEEIMLFQYSNWTLTGPVLQKIDLPDISGGGGEV